MPLAEPRKGESIGFSVYPDENVESTLASPETIVWSSIRHWCSQRAGGWYANNIYKMKNEQTRNSVAYNVGLYLRQASEFYDAASNAKPNTAPLFYYYSFLNFAKAICEIHHPRLHRRKECYAHGLVWRPDPLRVVRLPREKVTIGRRGVWHLLWESMMRAPCPATNPTTIAVLKLFSQCPDIAVESRLFGPSRTMIYLQKIEAIHDDSAKEVWLKFSISQDRLSNRRLSAKISYMPSENVARTADAKKGRRPRRINAD